MAADNGMNDSMIVDLFGHNTWANLRLLDACASLTEEQLDANVPGTFGAIRDTLLHIVGAEVSYVARVTGRRPENPPVRGQFPGIDKLREGAQWTGEELLQMALGAGVDDIVHEEWRGKKASYPLTALLTQAINHSTEHRAQIATILTQQGIEPPDMSGWEYMVATGRFQEEGDDTSDDA